MESSGTSPHLLVVFLTALGRCSTTPEVVRTSAELIAEELDAEVGAVIADGRVGSAVGFGQDSVPDAVLVAVRPGSGVADLPGIGQCHTLAAAWSPDGSGRLVAARVGASFDSSDRDLLLGMASAFSLATGAIRALERERARNRASEVLLEIQRSISRRVPLARILAALTDGASQLLDGCPVSLDLDDAIGPTHTLHAGPLLPPGPDVFAAPVHVEGIPAGHLRAVSRDGTPLGQEARVLLSTFAEHASLALADARTVAAMQEAFHDQLTGLPSRPLFLDRLTEALRERDSRGVSVLFIDLDRFKAVNDTLGHAAGDLLLRDVADRLRATTRAESSAARFGGDEFALLVKSGGDPHVPIAVADRVIAAIAKPFVVGGKSVSIGATVGIAHGGADRTASELLADADLAMYRAKASGGGRSATFDPQMRRDMVARLDLEADLHGALERGELSVVFQPILDLAADHLVAVEALLRWRHPARGMVSPSDFIPIAEANGLIVPIGRWVLDQACGWVSEWRASWPGLRVTVNVSVHQLREPGFSADVARALERVALAPDALTIEVTESSLMSDHDGTIDTLRALDEMGVRIALDDFGTGYSSLSYLQRFPVDMLKIDRSFVSGGLVESGDQMVRTIIELGRAYNLEVVAEGIEDGAQLGRLIGAGCQLGQGYLFGRPSPPQAIPALLNSVHVPKGCSRRSAASGAAIEVHAPVD